MSNLVFAFVNHSKNVRTADLYALARAVEEAAVGCALAWGVLPPAVIVAATESELPSYASPILFVDGDADDGKLAEHYWSPQRGPAARVFCSSTSGFKDGPYSICESASHEVFEAMVDPQVNKWADNPRDSTGRVQMALEICDPCQDYFFLPLGGTNWPMANYVTPTYFRSDLVDPTRLVLARQMGLKFDKRGTITAPGEIGIEGYAVMRSGTDVWMEDRFGVLAEHAMTLKAAKQHPLSRTSRRGVFKG